VGAQLRILRRKIRSVQSTKKITRAQELIAASRLVKAQQRVEASTPYAHEITNVLTALATNSSVEHPLLTARETVRRAGVVIVTSDRGFAGGYNANLLRTAESLIARLRDEGKEPVLFVIGRKGLAYFRFRQRPVAHSWTGFSESPRFADAAQVGKALVAAFESGEDDAVIGPFGGEGPDQIAGVDELHLVFTNFVNRVRQEPVARVLAPMDVVDAGPAPEGLLPEYEFEPDAEELLDALLPAYLNARIYSALLSGAASESAQRQRAMKSATDNAEDLVKAYTREANQARQAEITQEISEIVGGADALAAAGSEGS
jgi:F-type H+-transporting ATPase subunit gamma